MSLKLKYLRIVTFVNNIIGALVALVGVFGLINLLNDSAIGVGSRGSRGSGLVATTVGEVFVALIIAGIAGLFYLSLQKIKNKVTLERLLYDVLDNSFMKFYSASFLVVFVLLWIADPYLSFVEVLGISAVISSVLVMHLIVISIVYFTKKITEFIPVSERSDHYEPMNGEYEDYKSEDSQIKSEEYVDIQTIEAQLNRINEMFTKGLISGKEYKKKRDDILRNL